VVIDTLIVALGDAHKEVHLLRAEVRDLQRRELALKNFVVNKL
jgi:hypothetical protein